MMDMLGLTRREIECLQAKIEHGTNKKAALTLGITWQTYKNYLWVINRKLGAKNVTHAVVIAWVKRLVW
ncbi:LuxR C-terminal-related transcriptional regulator [Chloroflexota bacterium]